MVQILSKTKEKSPLTLARVDGGSLLASDSVSMDHYSTISVACQSSEKEIEQKFTPKKLSSELLGASYSRIGYGSKALRVSSCGTFLEFAHEISPGGEVDPHGKLYSANFCKDRLCPLCAWRRSYKIFAQVSQIMAHMPSEYDFLFLTLTVPSVPSESLSETITRLLRAWGMLIRYKRPKAITEGFFRALEVTRNNDPTSKSFGLYHPHIHAVLVVRNQYFKDRNYISRNDWLSMWQKAYRDDSITQVDVRRAFQKSGACSGDEEQAQQALSSAVAEIAKYAVKASDYIHSDDEILTDETVKTLSGALAHRRLAQYGGIFLDLYKHLSLDDAEDGDLIHINETINPALALLIVRYGWSAGAYKMTDVLVCPRLSLGDGEAVRGLAPVSAERVAP